MDLCKYNSSFHFSIAGLLYNTHYAKCFICIILFSLSMYSFHPLCVDGNIEV